AADANGYVAEMVRQAVLVGLRAEEVPDTEDANDRLVASFRPELLVTADALQAVDTVLHPPLSRWRRPVWWVAGQAALSLMPASARDRLGRRRGPLAGAAVRPLVRNGPALSRRRLKPPPVLMQARRRTEAAGLRF